MFDSVYRLSRHIQPIAQSEVEQLETHFGTPMPIGYKEFVTRFGLGTYCDIFRIYPPNQSLKVYIERREWWKGWYYPDTRDGSRHWFFEGSEEILSDAQLRESIIIGDSYDGDNLVFYPPQPDRIF